MLSAQVRRVLSAVRRRTIMRPHLIAKSPEFKGLFESPRIKRIATGFRFVEGPIWIEEPGYLLFSDIPASRIYKLESDGEVSVFREPSGKSNGLTLDNQGRLVICEHENRRVTREESDGSIIVLADSFQGKKLNSPNDVVVKNDGAIYFTDPPFGVKFEEQELPFAGVFRIEPESGEMKLLVDDFERPNGLAFSPDERKLYIDDSARNHVRVFDVNEDGTLANDNVFFDMRLNKPGDPDGMKLDSDGRVFCTGPGGIWVFTPEGKHLGMIVTPETPANCAWGDHDFRSLYITARTSIYKARLKGAGLKRK